jgi:hypothetical protein
MALLLLLLLLLLVVLLVAQRRGGRALSASAGVLSQPCSMIFAGASRSQLTRTQVQAIQETDDKSRMSQQ